jgi:protein-S-isoprenylcysteine O-methyltransferase Ste14
MEAIEERQVKSWGWPSAWWATCLRFAIRMALFVAFLFGSAGRFDWFSGWAFFVASLAGGLGIHFYVERKQPGLMKRRTRIGSNTKGWDKIWLAVYFTCYFAVMVVGALDAGRFGWAPLPGWATVVGLAVLVPCYLLFGWAMGVNRHFEATVRIQTDRNHQVVDTGPYRVVRHPGYVAAVLMTVGAALTLRSWLALLPGSLACLSLVIRTSLEDRTLQRELVGYADYARRVPYRLFPGLW